MHELFTDKDARYLNTTQRLLIVDGGLAICKKCGKAESELTEPCVPRTSVVVFRTADGAMCQARLVRENALTAIVKPYLWVKSKNIKIHKTKQHMKYTGRMI